MDGILNAGLPNVDKLDDVIEAIDVCEEYHVPYDGLEDVEDFIERIRLHFLKMSKRESRKQRVSSI